MIKDPSQDHIRMSAYPNLEYGNLYNAIAMLLDVAPNIQFGLNGKNKRDYYSSQKLNFHLCFPFKYLAKRCCSVWDVFYRSSTRISSTTFPIWWPHPYLCCHLRCIKTSSIRFVSSFYRSQLPGKVATMIRNATHANPFRQ